MHSNQDTWKVNKKNNLKVITMAKGHSLPHSTCERIQKPQHRVMHNLNKIRNQAATQNEGKMRNSHIQDRYGK